MSGPYSIQKLEELAADEEFGHHVREFARSLFAAGAVRDTRSVAPLCQYGPEVPGAALRLLRLPTLADLDGAAELQAKWADLLARFDAIVVDSTSP